MGYPWADMLTYDITTKYTDLSERMEFLYNQCTDLYGNHTPSYKKFRILEEGLHFPYFEIKAPSKLMFLCGNLALPKLPYFWKGRCAVGYLKAPLLHARRIAERRTREGNVFLDLMKVALNSSSFCVRGETTVSDIMAICFVGVPVPGKFLFEEANIVIEPNNLNLSHIITLFGSPQKPTKWTNQKKLVIEVKTILPAYDCVIYKHPEKRPEKVIYVPVPNKKVFHCSETEEVEAINQVLYLPKGWFLFCGLYAYAYIPAHAVGGPCTIGRLTTVMAVAHFKDINYKTEFYYEMMNASLYHTDRVQKKVMTKVTTHLTYVTENTAFKEVWGILTSWLPSFTWLRELFVGILLIEVICLISCLCIKCIPLCCNVWKCCCQIKKQKKLVEDSHGGLGRREVSIMLQDIHSFQE
ncbi:uncharacterized protein LOC117658588 [Pantherophis guttatus]|uniref:Uncharacterized protein LOC117658588 n=1 Tax=Pantherophis guttatus TaxID=94885 RepID=A0ABM3YYT9_PANGU|nr:uncharacterized protein LOC117658588 [Pantherophis guttatus]XP_060541299.1 uncharacterized protein LOC117658588 [Pantherophis guttatus]